MPPACPPALQELAGFSPQPALQCRLAAAAPPPAALLPPAVVAVAGAAGGGSSEPAASWGTTGAVLARRRRHLALGCSEAAWAGLRPRPPPRPPPEEEAWPRAELLRPRAGIAEQAEDWGGRAPAGQEGRLRALRPSMRSYLR